MSISYPTFQALLLLPSLLFLAACGMPKSPAATPLLAERPAVLEEDQVSVSASLIGGPEVSSGWTAEVRHGAAPNFELAGIFSNRVYQTTTPNNARDARLKYDDDGNRIPVVILPSLPTSQRTISALAVQGKYAPAPHFALVAGLGVGWNYSTSVFFSHYLGAIVGYDNNYLIPYASLRYYGSYPTSEIDRATALRDRHARFITHGLDGTLLGLDIVLAPSSRRRGEDHGILRLAFGAHQADDSTARRRALGPDNCQEPYCYSEVQNSFTVSIGFEWVSASPRSERNAKKPAVD